MATEKVDSMADLDDGIEPGDGTKPLSDLTKVDDKPADDKPQDKPKDVVDDKPKDVVDDKAKDDKPKDVVDDKKDDDKKDDDKKDDTEIAFYDAVDALTGRKIEVEYGDVDPETPQGAVIREKAVVEAAIKDYEAGLRERMPRAYDFFLHIQSGKPEKEFFDKPVVALPDVELFKTSVDLQKQVLTQDLLASGLSQKQVDAVIKAAIEEKTLTDDATAAYNKRKTQDEQERLASEKRVKEDTEKFQAATTEFASNVGKIVKEDMKDIVPEAKRADFLTYISKLIEVDDRGFLVTIPAKDNLANIIKSLYVLHTNANLKDAIETGAKQLQVRKLKKAVKDSGNGPAGGDAGGGNTKMVTLADMFGDPE